MTTKSKFASQSKKSESVVLASLAVPKYGECALVARIYAGTANTRLDLVNKEGEAVTVCTINDPLQGELPQNQFFIMNWEHHKKFHDLLLASGLFKVVPGKTYSTKFVKAPLFELVDDSKLVKGMYTRSEMKKRYS